MTAATVDLGAEIVDFGKHRGKRWADVPRGYLEWIIRENVNFDSAVAHAKAVLGDAPVKPKKKRPKKRRENPQPVAVAVEAIDTSTTPPWEGEDVPEFAAMRERLRSIGQSSKRETSDLDEEFRRMFGRT